MGGLVVSVAVGPYIASFFWLDPQTCLLLPQGTIASTISRMSDHQTPTDIADDVARESSEDELISFNEMKSILQDAEKRLLGQEPPPVDATIHGARTHSTLIARCVSFFKLI